MNKLLFALATLCLISFNSNAQFLPTAGGTMNGNITFSASNLQIQAPYYGINYGVTQPANSNNVAMFANSNTFTLDFVGWSNGWRFIPTSTTSYPAPVVSFSPAGNAVFGSDTGLPPGGSAITIKGPNLPVNYAGYQDINYSFNSAGSARIRGYRGGSWDTYLQFLVNKIGQGSDSPTVAMHIDQSGNVGIGTTKPGNKLQIADGADDWTPYGSVQITRAANPGDNRFHLSFIRNGMMVSGIGYVGATNTLGIWTGANTASTPVITFTQGQTVGIGTTNPGPYKLAVEGWLGARKIVVTQASPWADYVFDSSYNLKPISDVEQFINMHKHLPEVPSAAEVQKDGIDIGTTQVTLLKKIEELTLYMIKQNKEIEKLKKEVIEIKKPAKN